MNDPPGGFFLLASALHFSKLCITIFKHVKRNIRNKSVKGDLLKKPTATDLLNLSIPERIQLVEDLWDTIAAEAAAVELTEEDKKVIDERLEDYHKILSQARRGMRYFFFLLRSASPLNPDPTRRRVLGSGTVAVSFESVGSVRREG